MIPAREHRGLVVPGLLALLSVGLVALVGVLGPSAAGPPLDPGTPMHLGPVPATAMLAVSVVAGALATLTALRRALPWKAVVAAGGVATVLLCVVPPVGTADIGSYAAYGRLVVLGQDAYQVPPETVADPVVQAAEDPWRATPSVYGPLATAAHALAAELGHGSRRATFRWLQVLAGLSFAAAGVALLVLAGENRARAAVLWWGNPLLLFNLVSAAHVDGLLVAGVVLGLLAARRSRVAAGLVLGLAGCVKVTAGFAALALAVVERRKAVGYLVPAGATVLAAYAMAGGAHVLLPLERASGLLSVGTPWRVLRTVLEHVGLRSVARPVISTGVVLLTLALVVTLHRRFPREDDVAHERARALVVLGAAYFFAAGYALPWYDALVWAPLAVMAASGFDRLLLLHTTVLTLAYLPGRLLPLGDTVQTAQDVLRAGVTPVVLTALVVVLLRRPRAGRPARQTARQA